MGKTWQEKFDTRKEEKVKRLDVAFADIKAGELMLISTPEKITHYINSIPSTENRNLARMRQDLAIQAKADKTCPVTTGIFVKIIAERSLELMAQGKAPLAPFWKVIDPDSPLAKKISCGPGFIEK